jgi:integrase/recombinase XerD
MEDIEKKKKRVAGTTGLKPATSDVTGRTSLRFSVCMLLVSKDLLRAPEGCFSGATVRASSLPAAALVQAFFVEYLLNQKHASPRTLATYRDAFRLVLRFVHETKGVQPPAISVADLDAPTILAFLDHIEQERANCISSRNARLAAIRSFFRFVQMQEPAGLAVASRVLAIPAKRTERKLAGYLTRLEIDAILAATDQTIWDGRRDHALLLTLYNSGARVSEITGVRRDEIVLDAPASLKLHGKGRKERAVPLWAKTAQVLRAWFQELGERFAGLAFPSARAWRLSRHGVSYLLSRLPTARPRRVRASRASASRRT